MKQGWDGAKETIMQFNIELFFNSFNWIFIFNRLLFDVISNNSLESLVHIFSSTVYYFFHQFFIWTNFTHWVIDWDIGTMLL
jgi:hypothetical protein